MWTIEKYLVDDTQYNIMYNIVFFKFDRQENDNSKEMTNVTIVVDKIQLFHRLFYNLKQRRTCSLPVTIQVHPGQIEPYLRKM